MPYVANRTRALFMNRWRSRQFVVRGLGVRHRYVAVDREAQVHVADPRLLRSDLAALGSFGLLGPAVETH